MATIIISTILFGCVGFICFRMIRNHIENKKHGGCCSGCASCPKAGHCK